MHRTQEVCICIRARYVPYHLEGRAGAGADGAKAGRTGRNQELRKEIRVPYKNIIFI